MSSVVESVGRVVLGVATGGLSEVGRATGILRSGTFRTVGQVATLGLPALAEAALTPPRLPSPGTQPSPPVPPAAPPAPTMAAATKRRRIAQAGGTLLTSGTLPETANISRLTLLGGSPAQTGRPG